MALAYEGQAYGALPGVVGNCVSNQGNAAFLCNLLHNLGFADAGRAHQQDGPLPDCRDQGRAGVIGGQVGAHSILDFLFGAFDIHSTILLTAALRQVVCFTIPADLPVPIPASQWQGRRPVPA